MEARELRVLVEELRRKMEEVIIILFIIIITIIIIITTTTITTITIMMMTPTLALCMEVASCSWTLNWLLRKPNFLLLSSTWDD